MKLMFLLAVTAFSPPTQGTVEVDPYTLIELAGDEDATGQIWLSQSTDLDTRQYLNGSVFIATGKPGTTHRVQWVGTYVDWENQQFRQEFRTFTIVIRGPPVDIPPPVEPKDPEDPVNVDPDDTVTQVTYVHRHRDSLVPRDIQNALRQLDASTSAVISAVDISVRLGNGEIPPQYKRAFEAASDKLPSLVIETEDKVSKVIRAPAARQILEMIP